MTQLRDVYPSGQSALTPSVPKSDSSVPGTDRLHCLLVSEIES
jgi:hypothetical protein